MVERYRPKKAPLPITAALSPRIERYPPPKPNSPGEFAFLARQILSQPPLRHRGELPKAGLSVLEFCIGVSATVLARRSRAAEAHRAGLRKGKRAMTAKRNSEQPVHDKANPSEEFGYEGSAGFEHGRRQHYDDHVDQDWYATTSRNELLRYAGLSDDAANNKRVDDALDRLTRAVRRHPPVLVGWRELRGRWIEIEVRCEWLSLERYGKVKLPLPTSSRDALALYLFLIIINLSPRNKTSIPASTLYKRLGIRTGRPAHNERALRNALDRVNAHRTKKQGLLAIDLLDDGKGGWRFVEHGKDEEAISDDIIERAVSLREDGLSWAQIAVHTGETSAEIQRAVKSHQKVDHDACDYTGFDARDHDVHDDDEIADVLSDASVETWSDAEVETWWENNANDFNR